MVAAASFGLMNALIEQEQGVLEPEDPQRVGIVPFATLPGIAHS
ncbi:hypothetical protein [Nonomuraea cavernae]|uniref:Uncharacterized protein n=1 Tax=Nonomuraea cavernae TaxID=2045107 RepID=A0A917YNQ4_9ACTN|nr:hypothetical protein [Nonomuraea cavernae]GGO61837.1 hypothetical protein GCM10012289_05020 [Nonomuraea cavernae]